MDWDILKKQPSPYEVEEVLEDIKRIKECIPKLNDPTAEVAKSILRAYELKLDLLYIDW